MAGRSGWSYDLTALATTAREQSRFRRSATQFNINVAALMPSRPPGLKAKPKAAAHRWVRKQTTTERGYGWRHQQMRKRVLAEEPLCRACLAMEPKRYTPATIADHIKPLAEGGTDDRGNYQGLCGPCHDEKTQREAARARGAKRPRRPGVPVHD